MYVWIGKSKISTHTHTHWSQTDSDVEMCHVLSRCWIFAILLLLFWFDSAFFVVISCSFTNIYDVYRLPWLSAFITTISVASGGERRASTRFTSSKCSYLCEALIRYICSWAMGISKETTFPICTKSITKQSITIDTTRLYLT